VPKAARQRDARQTAEEDVVLSVKSKGFRKNLWDMHNQICATVRILLIAQSVGLLIVETKETDTSFGMLLLGAIHYLTPINWRCCSDSINSGNGIHWITNVTASVAARLLPDMKSR
jgi:hypothetical protein